jgi:hypothetical protein
VFRFTIGTESSVQTDPACGLSQPSKNHYAERSVKRRERRHQYRSEHVRPLRNNIGPNLMMGANRSSVIKITILFFSERRDCAL